MPVGASAKRAGELPTRLFCFWGCYSSRMALTTAAAALEILNETRKALENARERAQASKDTALKESIGKLYDNFNSLRSAVMRVTDENTSLRKSAEQPKPEAREVGETVYYYVGDKGPYCQPCYDRHGKLVPLTPRQKFAGGFGRKCQSCPGLTVFIEQRVRLAQSNPYRGHTWS